MVILGGSLTEVAFPLLFVGYFLHKREDGRRRDVFAAMVCLWRSAIGLLATAIYCDDSRAGELMNRIASICRFHITQLSVLYHPLAISWLWRNFVLTGSPYQLGVA